MLPVELNGLDAAPLPPEEPKVPLKGLDVKPPLFEGPLVPDKGLLLFTRKKGPVKL